MILGQCYLTILQSEIVDIGSSDLGPDPDWDTKTNRWTGKDKKAKVPTE